MKYHAITVYFHVYVTCVQTLNSFSDQIKHVIANVTLHTSDVIVFIGHDEARFLNKTCVDILKGRNVCAIRLFTYRWRPFVVAASTSEVSRAPFYAYLLKEVEPVITPHVYINCISC